MELPTIHDERAWVAKDIAAKLAAGVPAENIAVLARRHRELELLLPYLIKENIAVDYDKQHNILDIDSIKSIEHIAHILVALFEQRLQDADSLIPELLAHPAFGIAPLKIWQLSLAAQEKRQSWLEVMSQTPEFQPLHEWLISCSQQLPHTPLERMIDRILGSEEGEEGFVSPIANFYFSRHKLETEPETYLKHLEALRTLRTHLAHHHPNEAPSLQSLLEFMRLHRELGTSLMTTQPSIEAQKAVRLMTAHKSKGLEFDYVYIIGAVDSAWGERVRTRSRLISYPANLPLAPAGDTYDERLRLFFVAATRARNHLTISYSTSNDVGKGTLCASFLANEHWQPTVATIHQVSPVQTAELAWYQPVIAPIEPSMKDALVPLLSHYKLSATHVNAFLDVTHDGPQGFLINNLLRFPQAKTPSASYGSAIHTALQRAHSHLAATGKQRPHEDILHDYEEALRSWSLSDKDFHDYLQKGSVVLSTYLDAKYDTFSPTQKAELNFAGQSVFIGEAHLTGSLDLVDIVDDTIIITDYKTGRPARNWQGRDDYEKIKLHKYKQQLMFYCLLVANSRDYAKYPVKKATIQFVEATPQNEIVSLEASFSRDDLLEFSRLIQTIWRCIITLDFPDISKYDANYQGMLAFEKDLIDIDTPR
jgi:DNA helicase-2/ATP-dependent DNA helicase PcrA